MARVVRDVGVHGAGHLPSPQLLPPEVPLLTQRAVEARPHQRQASLRQRSLPAGRRSQAGARYARVPQCDQSGGVLRVRHGQATRRQTGVDRLHRQGVLRHSADQASVSQRMVPQSEAPGQTGDQPSGRRVHPGPAQDAARLPGGVPTRAMTDRP